MEEICVENLWLYILYTENALTNKGYTVGPRWLLFALVWLTCKMSVRCFHCLFSWITLCYIKMFIILIWYHNYQNRFHTCWLHFVFWILHLQLWFSDLLLIIWYLPSNSGVLLNLAIFSSNDNILSSCDVYTLLHCYKYI